MIKILGRERADTSSHRDVLIMNSSDGEMRREKSKQTQKEKRKQKRKEQRKEQIKK